MVSKYLVEDEKTGIIRRSLTHISSEELSWIVDSRDGSSLFNTKRDRKAAQWELLRRRAFLK